MSRHLLPVGLVMVVSAVWVPGAAAQFKMPKVGGWAGEAGRRASQGAKDVSTDIGDYAGEAGRQATRGAQDFRRGMFPGNDTGTSRLLPYEAPDRLVVVEGDPIPLNRQGASSAVAPQPANQPDPWRQLGEAIGRQIRDNQQNQMQQNQRWNNGYRQNNYQYQQNGYQQNGYRQNNYQQNGYQQNGYRQNGYQQNGYRQQNYQQNGYQQRDVYGNVIVSEGSPVYVDQGVVTTSGETVVSARPVISAAVPVNALPYKGPGVTIVLPEATGGEVSYLLDGAEHGSIRAGEERKLAKKSAYEIRFSRGRTAEGKDHGEARYTISEGTYHFAVTDRGWELLRQKQ